MIKGSCYNGYEHDFYGKLLEVVELEFLGDGNRVVLFKCCWFDIKRGVKVDRYGNVEVNFQSRLWSYEPFILASQATQVFYAPSVSRRNEDWCSVITTKARNTYNIPTRDEDDNIEPSNAETYEKDENPLIIPYEANEKLDVSLRAMGLGEEIDPKFLNVAINMLDEENEDDDEDNSMDIDD